MRVVHVEKVFIVLFFSLLGAASGNCASTIEQDVQALRNMTTWQISEPTWQQAPAQACGIQNISDYKRYRMDYGVSSKLSNEEATSQTAAFDHRIVEFLESHGWSRMDLGTNDGGIPNLKRCYKKQHTVVQIYKTTARCTMNTPCTVYDGFAVTFYRRDAR